MQNAAEKRWKPRDTGDWPSPPPVELPPEAALRARGAQDQAVLVGEKRLAGLAFEEARGHRACNLGGGEGRRVGGGGGGVLMPRMAVVVREGG